MELQRSHVSTVSGWHVFFCCLKIIAYMKLICIINYNYIAFIVHLYPLISLNLSIFLPSRRPESIFLAKSEGKTPQYSL